jgi:ATP-dependent Clp protease ATP-binding subunit ClpA
MTDTAKKVTDLALREALQLGHNYVGPEHLLLAIVKHKNNLGAQALANMIGETDLQPRLRREIVDLIEDIRRTGATPPREKAEENAPEPEKPAETHDVLGDLKEVLPLLGKLGSVVFEDLAERLRRL